MPRDLPEDLRHRLKPLTRDTGRGTDERLREAIEVCLALQAHAANTLDGWTPET
jgi:hypothetical protein